MKRKLNAEQLQMINVMPIEDARIDELRNVFLFCNLYGLNLNEATLLTSENVYSNENGNKYIVLNREDGKYPKLPLTKLAKSILFRFHDNESCQGAKALMPKVDVAEFKKQMSLVLRYCNINVNITPTLTRNTFDKNIHFIQKKDSLSYDFYSHYDEMKCYFIMQDMKKVKVALQGVFDSRVRKNTDVTTQKP